MHLVMHFDTQETGLFRFDDLEIPYHVCRSKRRRRTLSLSYGVEHGLRIMVPLRTSPHHIQRMLDERATWIQKRFHYLQQFPVFNRANEYADGARLPYLGQNYRLQIRHTPGRSSCTLNGSDLDVQAKNPAHARKAVLAWYRGQAEIILKERIDPLAARLNVGYRSLRIGNARRMWGSCSFRNDIRINWRILMAPPHLVDCLLAHELCHIVHKNHSPRFWDLLESLIPDQKACKRELRRLEADLLRRGR